jgi:hypothetical protein
VSDHELSGLLDKLDKGGKVEKEQAAKEEDSWVMKFDLHKVKVIRPTLEKLGAEIRAREHDFNIVDKPFKRLPTSPLPQEASIRMDIYLGNERTRTVINADRRPYLGFTTHHRSQMVQVTICDITSRGGVESKIGDFPLETIDAGFIRDKFVALFKRLLSQQPNGAL